MDGNRIFDQYKDIKAKLNSIIKRNVQSIEEMIDYTDQYYGYIADSLPQIEDNISRSMDETKILINCFTKDKASNDQQMVYRVMTNLRKRLESINQFLNNKDDLFIILNNIISGDGKEKETAFKKIINLTSGLKKILNRLKVLAINSSIYTYNNRNQIDNGFNVISDKIHSISVDMADNYQNIEKKISGLMEWQHSFQDNIEEVVRIEETIKNKYSMNLNRVFQEFFIFLNEITILLEELMGLIDKGVSPVYELMTEVQNQDIIRQNLENLCKILTKTGEEIDNGFNKLKNEQDVLEKLTFISDIINLSNKLMSSVQDQIDSSQERIELLLEDMGENLVNINKDLVELKNRLVLEKVSASQIEVKSVYNKIFSLLPQIQDRVKELKNKYTRLLSSETTFKTSIEGINNEFYAVNRLTDQLQNIQILASIELAVMMDENNFIKKIDKVINDLVTKNEDDIGSFTTIQKRLRFDFNNFSEVVSYTNIKMDNFYDDLKDSEENLIMIRETIDDKVLNLDYQLDYLSKINLDLVKGMKDFNNLTQLSNRFITALGKLGDKIEYIKKTYSDQKFDISNNRKLMDLFQEFTSYQERKTASEEYKDIEIDIGDNGGELTLF